MLTHSDSGSLLLDYLPAIYRRSEQIQAFLAPFQEILIGPDPELAEEQGRASDGSLQARIRNIPALFDPEQTSPEFLPWLAQWAVLSSHEGLSESRRRTLIKEIIPLYAIRGTKAYLERVLNLYTGALTQVEELDLPPMAVGVRSFIGQDTRLGEDPFQFRVSVMFRPVPATHEERQQMLELVHVVIGLAKPAHTHYQLVDNLTDENLGFVISFRSTVGIDSRL
jgi:phage tail-like protein